MSCHDIQFFISPYVTIIDQMWMAPFRVELVPLTRASEKFCN